MKTLIFDLEKGGKDRAIREATKLFQRAGAQVVSSTVDATPSKRAGVKFRGVNFTFADGQTVILNVKDTGDVFEVKINGKLTPLRYQDDHAKAIGEITDRMEAGRGAFQRALAKVRIPLPPSIRVSRAGMVKALTERRDNLKVALEEARTTLAKLLPAGAA